MNDVVLSDDFGVVTEPLTLQIQRRLPGTVDKVWSYFADSELRRRWLASGLIPKAPGGSFELTWRNDELTGTSEGRPEGFPAEHTMTAELLEIDPPHRLVFTWPPRGEVSFDLKPIASGVLLTVTHKRISDRKNMVMVGAGWHMHLDIMAARLAGRTPAAFWTGWARLKQDYDRLIPAE